MNEPNAHSPAPAFEPGAFQEDLNLYLDGELPFDRQRALFAHLAEHDADRVRFNALILFREWSRKERIVVPPAVDEAFLNRVTKRQRLHAQIDRARDRRPLWQARRRLPVWSITTMVVVVFLLGTMLQSGNEAAGKVREVTQEVERVHLDQVPPLVPHFVIYPGLTVE